MTSRKFEGNTLVIATHNANKAREFSVLLKDFVPRCVSMAELGLADVEETGLTFIMNAELKARTAAKASGLPALGDDSGFAVAGLEGRPGLYSARWAETQKGRDFPMAMARINTELGNTSDRRAGFVCALALAWPDGHVESVEGHVVGQFVWPPRGEAGFGYDPGFVPDGQTRTFAEMEPAEKNAISHRADAVRKMLERCFQ